MLEVRYSEGSPLPLSVCTLVLSFVRGGCARRLAQCTVRAASLLGVWSGVVKSVQCSLEQAVRAYTCVVWCVLPAARSGEDVNNLEVRWLALTHGNCSRIFACAFIRVALSVTDIVTNKSSEFRTTEEPAKNLRNVTLSQSGIRFRSSLLCLFIHDPADGKPLSDISMVK